MEGPTPSEDLEGPLAAERKMLESAKKLSLFAAGRIAKTHDRFADQQEIMGALADTIIEVFALESCLLRAEKLIRPQRRGEREKRDRHDQILCGQGSANCRDVGRVRVIAAVAEGDMLQTQTAILRRLAKYEPVNTVALSRQIAKQIISSGRYTV